MFTEIVRAILVIALAIILLSILCALPVMWLWNYLMPDIFGLPEIGFFKAFGLILFCSLLFRSASYSNNDE